ncbi:MAG: hypothetical protein IKN43_03460 [Selenomonadaceae bacterium]|nr:hypothetical protein [Selenomonadaceae bacterium]
MANLKPQDVFRPKSMPLYTYINRMEKTETYEAKLKRALDNPGTLVSIVGASKTGKTVLCNKVIDSDKIINLSGAQIQSQESFWEQIYEKLDFPMEYQLTESEGKADNISGKGAGKVSLPLIASADISAQVGVSKTNNNSVMQKHIRNNSKIIKMIIEEDMTLIIDDFHYINPDVQKYIARTLKTELFNGLKAILLSLPHRSDDAIRRNPDLIGRTSFIEIKSWTKDELSQIAKTGFGLLDIPLSEESIEKISVESAGSPQLMQENCLNLAYLMIENKMTSASESAIKKAFQITTENYKHYEDILSHVLVGPSQGKVKRKKYYTKDNKVYDIYHLLLLSISINPPILELHTDEILRRMMKLLKEDEEPPTKLNIANPAKYIATEIRKSIPDLDTIEWKDGTIYILDPFLLFYLRWTDEWKQH